MEKNAKSVTLSQEEYVTVDEKVQFELRNFQHKMVKLGSIISIFMGIFVIYALHHKTPLSILMAWYALLMVANTLNVGVSHKNIHILPSQTKLWSSASKEYYLTLSFLCLMQGAVGILYTATDANYQLYIITWLLLLVVGFSFGTITDYIACVLANVCILLPFIISRMFLGIQSIIDFGSDVNLNISLSIIPIILSVFSLITCYFGYKLVKNFFRLNFENIILTKKLEEANQFLETRVKERTLELENSLKLVTFQATHDLLTSLPNQRLLLEHAKHTISDAILNKKRFAVACLYLNEIEKINDSLGHENGNQVIKTIASRFDRSFKESVTIGSHTQKFFVTLSRKDELVIIIEPIFDNDDIEKASEKIFKILNEPILIRKQVINLTASIGISVYPEDGKAIKSLLMNADAAMLSAKKQGGNSLNIYKAEINADVYKKLIIENQLYNALENHEFTLNYQPFVDAETNVICGGEALIRWNNPSLGYTSPDKFIPIAEANGIILPLGEWIFRTACMQAAFWHKSGFNELKIAINLSAKQLMQKNIIQVIEQIIEEVDLNPRCIEIELTETEAFRKETIPTLQALKSMGFNLSIDDFGTGYSGLSNLKLFSIDKLKIDQSFVRDLNTNSDSQAIVANTIDLAKRINVTVLAEGVETIEQLEFLREHGCNMIQGYYFSKPIDADAFTELLKTGIVKKASSLRA